MIFSRDSAFYLVMPLLACATVTSSVSMQVDVRVSVGMLLVTPERNMCITIACSLAPGSLLNL